MLRLASCSQRPRLVALLREGVPRSADLPHFVQLTRRQHLPVRRGEGQVQVRLRGAAPELWRVVPPKPTALPGVRRRRREVPGVPGASRVGMRRERNVTKGPARVTYHREEQQA